MQYKILNRMKKLGLVILSGLIIFALSGCLGFKALKARKGASAQEGPSLELASLEKRLSVIVGFIQLVDKRPKQDIAYMTSVREKVSSEVLGLLKKIDLFDEIHSPVSEQDELIFSGEIRRFGWKSFDTMISYIPGLNILPFFGLPSTRVETGVEIFLLLKNRNTGKAILEIDESYSKRRKYNIYNFKQEKAEAELAQCFNIVLGRIKSKIIANKGKILEEVKSLAISKIKPAAEKKSEPILKEPKQIRTEDTLTEEVAGDKKQEVPDSGQEKVSKKQEIAVPQEKQEIK